MAKTRGIFTQVITDWVNAGATVVTATTTNPTKGTIMTDQMWWRRVGENMELRIALHTVTSGSSGSGDYLWAIPAGYAIDTSKLTISNAASSSGAYGWLAYSDNNIGSFQVSDGNGQTDVGGCIAYSSTQFRMVGGLFANTGNTMVVGDPVGFGHAADMSYTAILSFPVVGWSAND